MINKSTVLFAALISMTLPAIAEGGDKNSPNTQEIQATASPTAGESNTRISTVPAGLKGHFVVKSEDGGSGSVEDVEERISTVPAGLKGHFVVKSKDGSSEGMKDSNLTSIKERVVVKSEDGGSGSVKESKTRRFTVPAGLKGHFVIVSEDNDSGSMKDNKPEVHQK